jgi:3-deoxy-manno-octulosonate cytidylyltransferase (CMP-KDO synthetase)
MIAPLIKYGDIPMATLKHRITERDEIEDSNIVKVVTDNDGFALYFSRYPIPFCREHGASPGHYKHLGLYAYRMGFLSEFSSLPIGKLEATEKLEQLRALEHGFRIKVVETASDSVEVDAPADIKKVEGLLQHSSK